MKAIITFHSIDNRGTVLSFPPTAFAEFIAGMLDSSISICSLDQLLENNTDNAIAITFDDGMQSVYEHAMPVLREAQVPSHLYLTTGTIGGENDWPTQSIGAFHFSMMNWSEIEACVAAGMKVENHTVSHPDLRKLDWGEIEEECDLADQCIASQLGRSPRHFAYPYGAYDARISRLLGNKYESCVTTKLLPLGQKIVKNELPRLDSYYLKNRRFSKSLFSPSVIAYLRLRHYLRLVREKL